VEWLKPRLLAPHLHRLDGRSFASLCSDVLSQVAANAGISRTHLDLSLNVTDPDGGVDARCRGAPQTAGRLIPAPNVAYQFKGGGDTKSAARIARDDIARKPRVVEALAAGETFVYVAAADYGPDTAKRVRAALKKNHRKIRIRANQLVVINGETLAQILLAFPGVVQDFLGIDAHLLSLEQWGRIGRLSNEYQTDDDLAGRVAALRTMILAPHSETYVVGPAGNGKTRFVLESLKGSDVALDVWYAGQPDHVTPSVWAHLREQPDVRCALVVDEVDKGTAASLREFFKLTQPGVRLVMIGRDASGRAQAGRVEVPGLNEDLLVRAIKTATPGLPDDAARAIARLCERSPKLAIFLAERAGDDPRLVEHHQRLADGSIRDALDLFVPLAEADWRALSSVALLEYVGWKDEADGESVALFELVELNPTEARDRVHRLHERFGIAPLVGRFRYVSPEILADHLAIRLLDAWTGEKFREMIARFPPQMTARVAARVRRIAGVLANAHFVEEVILGDQGPFRTLADLEGGALAPLLPELAGPFRGASLGALRRLIGAASDDELRATSASRRHLVHALSELLWLEDTFEDAAALLLRLAANENETWANNATGLFAETFQTQLGRTAADLTIRARVLRRAAGSANAREREVAAKAIEAGLKTEHIVRMGMPPTDVPGMPAREWRPRTYGEWYDVIETYLGILSPLLRDQDGAVRVAAIEALAEATVVACGVPRITDAWLVAARHVIGADFDLRAKLLNALELEFDRVQRRDQPEDMKEEEKIRRQTTEAELLARLRAFHGDLAGADFSSRFRRTLTRAPWSTMRRPLEEEAARIREALQGIATEVLQDLSLLDGEWDWLLRVSGSQPEQFSEILGRADRERRLADKLTALARYTVRATGWLSLYEIGYAHASGDPNHVDRLAAALVGDATRAPQLFDLLMRAGHSSARVHLVADLFKTKAVPGESIASLTFSSWRTSISPTEALEVVSAAAQDPKAIAAVVMFLGHYLHDAVPATRLLFQRLVVQVLSTSRAEEKRRHLDWEWDGLAKLYVADAPIEIAAAVLQDIAVREYAHDRQLDEIFKQAWAAAPDKRRFFTEVVAPWLDAETTGAWWVRQALEHFPVGEVGVDFLVDWVAEKPDPRAHALADVLGQPLGRPSDLHAALLERFSEHGVDGVFFGGLISGTWMGSASSWSKGKLAEAKQWLEDERPVIREWAKRAVASLEQMVQHDLVRDAEDTLGRR
jgi:hypothetical protein